MSTQNLDELYDDILDTLMQNFIDSVPLVPTGRNSQAQSNSQHETNVNESVINNMFNIRRNLQYNSTRTSSRNRAYIPHNASVTMQNGRISGHQNISNENLDILRTIFNPNGLFNQNAPSIYSRTNSFGTNRTHTDHTTTTTTTTTTRVNGRTTHTHTSTTHTNNERSNEQSTQNDTELTDMLSNMTSTIFSSLFGGQAIWLDEINNANETGIPLQDVKVTLSNEQFNKLQRIPISKCDNQTCHICMDEFDEKDSPNDAIKLACSHIFHQDCIRKWLCNEKVTCPVCRADVRESL